MKLYFDSLTTLKVIHAESPVVIFFGTYGTPTFYTGHAQFLNKNKNRLFDVLPCLV